MSNSKKLNVNQLPEGHINKVLTTAMEIIKKNGVVPIMIIAQMPNGDTVDLVNGYFCKSCVGERVSKIGEYYKETFSKHTHGNSNVKPTDLN